MRACLPALALAALLALPALPLLANADAAAPAPPAGAMPVSHEFWTPYMHLLALDIAKGIRPGAWLDIGPANCTASFVVEDPAGALYITTASHCTHSIGERAAVTQDALVAALAKDVVFGTVVARWPQGADAALILIDPDKYDMVDPTMTGWGGPTGLYTDASNANVTLVRQYGWGWVTWEDQQTRCRTGVSAPGEIGPGTWWYAGEVGGGDSGSATMTSDGLALGVLDWAGSPIIPTPTGAFIGLQAGGTRFDAALRAFHAVGFDVSLVPGGPVNLACMPEPPLPVP